MNNIQKKFPVESDIFVVFLAMTAHIAQNIAETCQKYLWYFIVIAIVSQHFRQIL